MRQKILNVLGGGIGAVLAVCALGFGPSADAAMHLARDDFRGRASQLFKEMDAEIQEFALTAEAKVQKAINILNKVKAGKDYDTCTGKSFFRRKKTRIAACERVWEHGLWWVHGPVPGHGELVERVSDRVTQIEALTEKETDLKIKESRDAVYAESLGYFGRFNFILFTDFFATLTVATLRSDCTDKERPWEEVECFVFRYSNFLEGRKFDEAQVMRQRTQESAQYRDLALKELSSYQGP